MFSKWVEAFPTSKADAGAVAKAPGPYQILLITRTAIKVPGRQTWVHVHHCKRAPAPPPSEDQEEKQMMDDAP